MQINANNVVQCLYCHDLILLPLIVFCRN